LFSGLFDSICKRVEEIEIPLKEMTIVFDRGMDSTDNIKQVLDKMHVVGALPSSICKDLYQIPLPDYEEEWENGKKNKVKAHLIKGTWYEKEFLLGMGKTVAFTDKEEFTTKEIVEMYDSRNMIEDDMKWLKDKLLIPIKPVYARKGKDKISCVSLCNGALLYNYLLHLIDDQELTIQMLSSNLEKIRMGLVNNRKGEKSAEFVVEEMNKETAEIFAKLQLGKYIPS